MSNHEIRLKLILPAAAKVKLSFHSFSREFVIGSSKMAIRTDFFRTVPGLLKLLQIVFSLVGLVLYLIDNDYFAAKSSYFLGVIVAMIVAVVIMMFYLLGISEALGPFMGLQTYFHLIWMMYMTGFSSIVLHSANSNFEAVCAGIFGLILALTYLVDGIHSFRSSPPMPFSQ